MGARALKILGRVTVTSLPMRLSFEMDDFLTIFQGDYRGCKFLPGVLRLCKTRPHASVIRVAAIGGEGAEVVGRNSFAH